MSDSLETMCVSSTGSTKRASTDLSLERREERDFGDRVPGRRQAPQAEVRAVLYERRASAPGTSGKRVGD